MCSPSSGAPRRAVPGGEPESFTGVPSDRTVPRRACSTSITRSRAAVWGCSSISPTVDTGPAGTPASSNAASHASVVLRFRSGDSASTSSARCSIRSRLRTKRGSSRRSSAASARVSRVQVASFEAPTLIQPSAVRKAW